MAKQKVNNEENFNVDEVLLKDIEDALTVAGPIKEVLADYHMDESYHYACFKVSIMKNQMRMKKLGFEPCTREDGSTVAVEYANEKYIWARVPMERHLLIESVKEKQRKVQEMAIDPDLRKSIFGMDDAEVDVYIGDSAKDILPHRGFNHKLK